MHFDWVTANSIPGTLALFALVALVLPLRKREDGFEMQSWLYGLFFILLSQIFYYLTAWKLVQHALVLECQLLAGISFACFRAHRDSPCIDLTYVGLNTLPLMAIEAIYGVYYLHPAPYLWACAAGVLLMAVATWWRRLPLRYLLLATAGYMLLAWLAWAGHFRTVAYWTLATVFGLTLWRLRQRLPRKGNGRIAILGSLIIGCAYFASHPVVVLNHDLQAFAESIYIMQKFFLVIGMLLVLLEEQAARHEKRALHDELTGLPNRRMLDGWLEEHLSKAAASGLRVSVLAIDLDGFKTINDRHGHAAGDAILREMAQRLRNHIGPGELAARIGGDEFVLACTSSLHKDRLPHAALEREYALEQALHSPVLWRDTALRVGASLGMASFPEDTRGSDPEAVAQTMLRVADERMYAQKNRSLQVTGAR